MRFSEILLIATTLTGVIWLLDALFLKPRRMMNVISPRGQSVKEPWWVEYSKSFFPILVVVFLLRSFLAEPFRIPSGSMHPLLLEGDFIIVNKYDYGLRLPIFDTKLLRVGDPKRGDVIVFKHVDNGESIDMIKRVIGLPNDHIQYKNKMVYINGEPMKQEFIKDTVDMNERGMIFPVRELIETLGSVKHTIYIHPDLQPSNYAFDDFIVPSNQYFVMGDNRDNSKDGRMWGFVPDKDIQGRAFGIWMSWDSITPRAHWWDIFTQGVRWNRLMTPIK